MSWFSTNLIEARQELRTRNEARERGCWDIGGRYARHVLCTGCCRLRVVHNLLTIDQTNQDQDGHFVHVIV